MEASIDSYAQMMISLSPEAMMDLTDRGYTVGPVWRSHPQCIQHQLPLGIFVVPDNEDILASGMPLTSTWKEKEWYQVNINASSLEAIKAGRRIRLEPYMQGVTLRCAEIGLQSEDFTYELKWIDENYDLSKVTD